MSLPEEQLGIFTKRFYSRERFRPTDGDIFPKGPPSCCHVHLSIFKTASLDRHVRDVDHLQR